MPDTAIPASLLSELPSHAAPKAIGRRVAEEFLGRTLRFEQPEAGAGRYSHFHYAEGLTWFGALRVARHLGDAELSARLVARFEPYLSEPCLPKRGAALVPSGAHVDERVFGVLPLELFLLTSDRRYLELGLRLADAQWSGPTADGITSEARYWIDDMYMITALQVQAFRATGDGMYIDRAARTLAAYLERLQQPNGLFFHTLESPVHWGRGNGWVAAGMTELLSELEPGHPLHAPILAGYRRMLGALAAHQSADGRWRQIVDDGSAWPESSATAMFTFALVSGVRRRWIDARDYADRARRGWLGTTSFLDEQARLRDVCVGAGHAHHVVGTEAAAQRRYYLGLSRAVGDLHGQAPLTWAAAALLA